MVLTPLKDLHERLPAKGQARVTISSNQAENQGAASLARSGRFALFSGVLHSLQSATERSKLVQRHSGKRRRLQVSYMGLV
jgi:hypothetical protein